MSDLKVAYAQLSSASAGAWSGVLTELVQIFQTLDADLAKEG